MAEIDERRLRAGATRPRPTRFQNHLAAARRLTRWTRSAPRAPRSRCSGPRAHTHVLQALERRRVLRAAPARDRHSAGRGAGGGPPRAPSPAPATATACRQSGAAGRRLRDGGGGGESGAGEVLRRRARVPAARGGQVREARGADPGAVRGLGRRGRDERRPAARRRAGRRLRSRKH